MNRRLVQCLHKDEHSGSCCNLILNDLNKFYDHLRTHIKDKPFKCSFPGCDAGFSQKGNRDRHENSHLGIKKFKCDVCDKTFSNGTNLRKHK